MQGAFNLKIEGNLDKIKQWLKKEGMLEEFYVSYPTKKLFRNGRRL